MNSLYKIASILEDLGDSIEKDAGLAAGIFGGGRGIANWVGNLTPFKNIRTGWQKMDKAKGLINNAKAARNTVFTGGLGVNVNAADLAKRYNNMYNIGGGRVLKGIGQLGLGAGALGLAGYGINRAIN